MLMMQAINKSAKNHRPMHYNMAPVEKKKGGAKNILSLQICAVASARGEAWHITGRRN